MEYAKKVVLVSINGYCETHDVLLQEMIDKGVHLLCVTGKDCEYWEKAMDCMCLDMENNLGFVVTSRHPDQPVDEVIAFARQWHPEETGDQVTVLEI
ncbi:MAG: DUF7684 family protein [Desulfovibrionales bacterium]